MPSVMTLHTLLRKINLYKTGFVSLHLLKGGTEEVATELRPGPSGRRATLEGTRVEVPGGT